MLLANVSRRGVHGLREATLTVWPGQRDFHWDCPRSCGVWCVVLQQRGTNLPEKKGTIWKAEGKGSRKAGAVPPPPRVRAGPLLKQHWGLVPLISGHLLLLGQGVGRGLVSACLFFSTKGAYGNVTEELFVLNLQPVRFRVKVSIQLLHPTAGGGKGQGGGG